HGLVIGHFLEMRHAPSLVGGIAMKSAAELIKNAAPRNLVEAFERHSAKGIVLKKAICDREANRRKIVEARSAATAESARGFVVRGRQRGMYFSAQGSLVGSAVGDGGRRLLRNPFCERGGLALHGVGVFLIGRRDALEKR